MKKSKVKFCKVSILSNRSSPSEPGTPPKKTEFGYLIQRLSNTASFIYCFRKAQDTPQARISENVSAFYWRQKWLPALLQAMMFFVLPQELTIYKTENKLI